MSSLLVKVLVMVKKRVSESPEVQVLWRRRPGWYQIHGAVSGSEPGLRWIWSGQDVVDAELDLRLWLPLLVRGRNRVVLLGAGPGPLGVQRAEGGARFRHARRWSPLVLRWVERGLCWIPEAQFQVPPAPAPPKVSVLKKVEHRLAPCSEGPEVPFPLLVAFCPRNLDEAAVERQVVADGVLPGSLVGPVVREALHDEVVDAGQSDPLLRVLLDRHGDQSDVAVRRSAYLPVLLGPGGRVSVPVVVEAVEGIVRVVKHVPSKR